MALHTKLCDLLGVKHPIMLAGMGGVFYVELVAAVSNAGGSAAYLVTEDPDAVFDRAVGPTGGRRGAGTV